MEPRSALWALSIAVVICLTRSAAGQGVVGAGSSAAAPLYTALAAGFAKAPGAAKVTYDPTGSGAGVKAFLAGAVDFAGTDAALTAAEIAQAKAGALVLPLAGIGIGVAYNLPGVTSLKLGRKALAGIFSGTVKAWNDPLIAADNAGVKLPATPVVPIVRSDSSGSTFIFTGHLAAIDPKAFKASTLPDWTLPAAKKAKGSSGVADAISTTPGAVGYIEVSNKLAASLKPAQLQNKKGDFVAPTLANINAALAAAKFPADGYAVNVPDPDAGYPVVGLTYMVLAKKYTPAAKGDAVKKFAAFALSPAGQALAAPLSYATIPAAVTARATKDVAAITAARR